MMHFRSQACREPPDCGAMHGYIYVCLKVMRLGALTGAVWHC